MFVDKSVMQVLGRLREAESPVSVQWVVQGCGGLVQGCLGLI